MRSRTRKQRGGAAPTNFPATALGVGRARAAVTSADRLPPGWMINPNGSGYIHADGSPAESKPLRKPSAEGWWAFEGADGKPYWTYWNEGLRQYSNPVYRNPNINISLGKEIALTYPEPTHLGGYRKKYNNRRRRYTRRR